MQNQGTLMTPSPPARQLCPLCGHEDFVTTARVDDEWVVSCSSHTHPPMEWRPKEQYQGTGTYRNGIGQELGVYDDLLDCVHDGFAEYGVIEYRFSKKAPRTYQFLVDRYSHTALGPAGYSTSAFLGGALGQLWREELVAGFWAPATGYWSYNGRVGAYGPADTPESDVCLSWEEFAVSTLGAGAYDWPPLGYRAEER